MASRDPQNSKTFPRFKRNYKETTLLPEYEVIVAQILGVFKPSGGGGFFQWQNNDDIKITIIIVWVKQMSFFGIYENSEFGCYIQHMLFFAEGGGGEAAWALSLNTNV